MVDFCDQAGDATNLRADGSEVEVNTKQLGCATWSLGFLFVPPEAQELHEGLPKEDATVDGELGFHQPEVIEEVINTNVPAFSAELAQPASQSIEIGDCR